MKMDFSVLVVSSNFWLYCYYMQSSLEFSCTTWNEYFFNIQLSFLSLVMCFFFCCEYYTNMLLLLIFPWNICFCSFISNILCLYCLAVSKPHLTESSKSDLMNSVFQWCCSPLHLLCCVRFLMCWIASTTACHSF